MPCQLQDVVYRLRVCVHAKSLKSGPTLCDPMDFVTRQAHLSMGFSRQEYWSGLPCPSPGNLPNPGNKPVSPVYPALLANSLLLKPLGKPISCLHFSKENKWSATPCPFTFQLSIFFVAAFISCLVFFARVDVCFCFAIILVEFSEDTKVNM